MPITYNAPYENEAYLRNYVGNALAVQQQLQDQKNQAMRWQGARDYDTLVQSGVDPRKALQRTAPKLFFNEPRALAGAVPSMLSQPGRIMTDPQSGRQFTVDRFGNYKAVPQQPTGYTSYTDQYGQRISRPIQPGEPLATGQAPAAIPTPQQGPGGRLYFPQTGGRAPVPVYRDPVEITRAKAIQKDAELRAASKLDLYRKVEAAKQGGEKKYGWPDKLPGGQPIDDQLRQLTKELEQIGFDTEGRIIEGSVLHEQVSGITGAPPPATGQGAPAYGAGVHPPGDFRSLVPPPAAAPPPPPPAAGAPVGLPPAVPRVPRRLPGGFQRIPGIPRAPRGLGPQQQRQLRGATAPAATSPQPQLGPNEVLRYRTDNGEPIIENTVTGARRRP